jgi:hypothetical protein
MQHALNTIQTQGHIDNEEDAMDALPPAEAPADQNNLPILDGQPEHLMKISAAAYNGYHSGSAISLLLCFPKATAVALANTGNTTTFMDISFATKYKIQLTTTAPRTVTVAGGSNL